MSYQDNDHKFIAVLNAKAQLPVLFNALAHVMAGLQIEPSLAQIVEYPNDDNKISAYISKYPVIVLSAKNAGQVRGFVDAAKAAHLPVNFFTAEMIGASLEHQLETHRKTHWNDLNFLAAVVFGHREQVAAMSKKFSLYRAREE